MKFPEHFGKTFYYIPTPTIEVVIGDDETHWREGHMQSVPQLRMMNSVFPSSHVDYGRLMAYISYPYATILALWVFMNHMLLSLTRSLTRGAAARVNEGYSKGGSGGGYSRLHGNSGGDFGGNRGREEMRGYGQALPSVAASYDSGAEGNYQPLSNSYGGNTNFVTSAVPPPTRYTGGYGGSSNMKGSRERGQHDGGYGGAQNIGGGYGGTPPESPVKIYTDDSGKCKGDAVLSYEDPSAAHYAGGFYNNHDLRGYKINVAKAEKSAPRDPSSFGHGFYEWNVFHPLEKPQKRLGTFSILQLALHV
ncbi:hypothetical protein GIB67_023858 [Kingdonia uniflora]|uniref:Uncharacterized protein n=1 Tax=Kingdonia uniflora TaxID=39325 RepID=A0A7J7NGY0_9MAGN|nr:hypothetical protein GIB67_023858 [Kingdonia uniflora]